MSIFEDHRAALLGLAYRMLGSVADAEDIVQEAWLRWESRRVEVDAPRAYLARVVTNLCLNRLDSAHARREQQAGSRLPEPIDLADETRLDTLDAISLAFMVVLQRLTPAERAVFLLHEVFDFGHAEIAAMLERSEASSRQLLRRARAQLDEEKRCLSASPDDHRRLLDAFVNAVQSGDVHAIAALLADDVTLVADAGPRGGTYGRVRALPGPVVGAAKVAAFVSAATARGPDDVTLATRELNGLPAIVVLRGDDPFAVLGLAVDAGKIARIFIQADPLRLARLKNTTDAR